MLFPQKFPPASGPNSISQKGPKRIQIPFNFLPKILIAHMVVSSWVSVVENGVF
jgi:hypothetical protein